MTEKEAWLEIAEMFESAEPVWEYSLYPTVGICDAGKRLCYQQCVIHADLNRKMMTRLGKYFNPNGKDVQWEYFWADDTQRPTRDLRATACCFLAAMCDTVTPKRRGKGS